MIYTLPQSLESKNLRCSLLVNPWSIETTKRIANLDNYDDLCQNSQQYFFLKLVSSIPITRAQACIMENNMWSFCKALDHARESRTQTQHKSHSSIFQENTQTCHLKSRVISISDARSIVARHVTPHSASAAVLRGARCSLLANSRSMEAKSKQDAIKSDRRWGHGSTTRAPVP